MVLDSHSAIWHLNGSPRLSTPAKLAIRAAVNGGNPLYLSAVTIAEITYLVERRKLLPQELADLIAAVKRPDSDLRLVPFDLAVAEAMSRVPRHLVPDMPDRMIAATALQMRLPLVTADSHIRSSGITTIW